MKIECDSTKVLISPIEVTLKITLQSLSDLVLIKKMYEDGIEVSNHESGDNDSEMTSFYEHIIDTIHNKIY